MTKTLCIQTNEIFSGIHRGHAIEEFKLSKCLAHSCWLDYCIILVCGCYIC